MKNSHDENSDNLIMENIRLVHYVLSKMRIKQQDYNDLMQVGTIGLINAARTFDPSRSKFSTYAIKCIRNEIFIYLRREKKEAGKVYIQDEFTVENKDSTLSYEELIEDKNARFSERLENCEEIERILSIVLNRMKKREKLALLYDFSQLTKKEVLENLNTSRQYLFELQRRTRSRLDKLIKDNKTNYKKRYEVKVALETYSILLIINDIENTEIFSNIDELKNNQKLEECSIECKDNKIMVKMPMDLICFYIMAQIVQIVE